MWTCFMDMHSGGGTKEGAFDKIFIEAAEDMAQVIFYNRFGHNPNRVSCTCCGEDYSITESETLEAATGYHRGLRSVKQTWGKDNEGVVHWLPENCYLEPDAALPEGETLSEFGFRSEGQRKNGLYLDEYVAQPDVLVIRDEQIKPEEREGDVPEQGFVWQD